MKKIVLVLLVASLLALGGQAFADLCTIDNVPAATLLLPYFEVDYTNAAGTTTLFTINNASAAPALAHVTLWTDWTQPTIDFDVFLTGYDIVPVNLFDVFQGNLPVTADAQNDGADLISPHGLNPQWDGSFPGCLGVFPFNNPVVSSANLTRLQNGHTGQDVLGLGCMGEDHSDAIARGYITIDNVNQCSTVFPNETGYFVDGGVGIANDINELWGDYYIVDQVNAFSFGEPLVAIEADPQFNAASTPTGYTFYGRYDPGLTGSDNREPLATTWATRYIENAGFTGGTDLLVWRDSTTSDTQQFYACGSGPGAGPSWNPLNETEVVAFDEQENAVEICFNLGGGVISPPDPDVDPPCFPLETQRATVGDGNLALPYESGWMFLNLNIDDIGVAFDVDFGSDGSLAQSHVTTTISALGLFQVGYSALPLTSACDDVNPLITDTGVIPSAN